MRLLAAVAGGLIATIALAAGEEPAMGKRHGVTPDLRSYPQSSPRQTLRSVLAAIKAKRLDYLMAQLAEPAFVDDRVQRIHGGSFAALVEDARRRLDPATIKLLQRFLEDGEMSEQREQAVIRLGDVKDRCLYFRKKGERWYLENRSKPPAG